MLAHEAKLLAALEPATRLEFARSVGFEPEPWQLQVLESDAKQIILNCSRGSGKSAMVGVLALWNLVSKPGFEILVLSRSDDAAMELVYNLRKRFQLLPDAPRTLKLNDHEMILENQARLMSVACDDDTPRGYHVDMVVEDEAAMVPDAVYNALRPTIHAKGGRYLMLSTPKGRTGHFFRVWNEMTTWQKIQAIYTDCKRFDAERLKEIGQERMEMGETWFCQEYLGKFLEATGQLFSEEAIVAAFEKPVEQRKFEVEW